MSPVGQGTNHVLAAQFCLSISLVGFTRVISFLPLLLGDHEQQTQDVALLLLTCTETDPKAAEEVAERYQMGRMQFIRQTIWL